MRWQHIAPRPSFEEQKTRQMPEHSLPRRARDSHGAEIRPMTLADMRGLGVRSVDAYCQAPSCGHSATILVDALSPATFVPDVALRLRCSACGSKKVYTRPSWKEGRGQVE